MQEVVIPHIQAECLEMYAKATGRSVSNCLEEALEEWIRVIALPVLREVSQNAKCPKVIEFRKRAG